MASLTVLLPDPMGDWVQERVDRGQFANASDYLRALIQRDHEREEAALAGALIEGEASGISDRTVEDIIGAVRAR